MLLTIFLIHPRSIPIKACFNINKRSDCKHKYVVALYTNEDCFPIAFDTEDELSKWYITLLKIQLSDQVAEGEELKPRYGKEEKAINPPWKCDSGMKGLGIHWDVNTEASFAFFPW